MTTENDKNKRGFEGFGSLRSSLSAEADPTESAPTKSQSTGTTAPASTPANLPNRGRAPEIASNATPHPQPTQPASSSAGSTNWWLVAFGVSVLAALGLGLLGERGRSKSPTAGTNPPAASEISTELSEDRPNVGTDNLLSANQLNYCLAEAIRLEGMRSAVGSDNSQIDRYNAAVEDSNSRCGSYRYHENALQAARSRVDQVRAKLLVDGLTRILGSASASPEAPSDTVGTAGVNALPQSFRLVPLTAFIVVDTANLREAPDERSAIVAALPAMTAVNVLDPTAIEWFSVTTSIDSRELSGFISTQLVEVGDRREALGKYCNPNGPERPLNGFVIQQSRRGDHQLRVKAANSDVLVKLKTATGSTALAFYVRANETGQVTSLADGDYYVYFATGRNFSAKCMEFLDDMSVQKDASLASFQTSVRGDYIYHSSAEYQLTTRSGGNFHPSQASPEEFR